MKVLLAVDYSSTSGRTVHACAEHPWPSGTVFRVLSAAEKTPPSAVELWYDASGDLEAVWTERQNRAQEFSQQAAAMLQNGGWETEIVVRMGRRRKLIALEAVQWPADVVIDAARGLPKSGLHPRK